MKLASNNSRGITFDQVRDAVERLTADGSPVSTGTIREVLGGTGSKTTISKFLTALREQQGTPGHIDTSGLSDQLVQVLAKEVARVASARNEGLDKRLEEARSTIRSLIDENESLTDELVAVQDSLEEAQRLLAEKCGEERELRVQLTALSQQRLELELIRQRVVAADTERASLEERLTEAKDALARSESRGQQMLERIMAAAPAGRN